MTSDRGSTPAPLSITRAPMIERPAVMRTGSGRRTDLRDVECSRSSLVHRRPDVVGRWAERCGWTAVARDGARPLDGVAGLELDQPFGLHEAELRAADVELVRDLSRD